MNIFRRDAQIQTVTIASGQTTSSVIKSEGFTSFAAQLPAAFTGVALTFLVSTDNVTFVGLNNASGAVSLTVAAGKGYALPADLTAWPYFQIVSGAAEGAARSIVVAMKA